MVPARGCSLVRSRRLFLRPDLASLRGRRHAWPGHRGAAISHGRSQAAAAPRRCCPDRDRSSPQVPPPWHSCCCSLARSGSLVRSWWLLPDNSVPVATENLDPGGTDAVMGYPPRWDDRPLEAARRIARRIVQIAGGPRSRDGISPPAAACAEAVRASQAQVAHCRSADLRLAVPAVPVAARSCGHLPARDAGALASQRLPPVLALEVPSPRRPACGPGRDPRSDPGHQPRQPALGCATHSWRAAETGIDIAQSTVAKYMPRRRRPPSPGWRAFLRSHTAHIAAVDLFIVPTIGFKLLYGLVILRLERRRLVWTNVTANPTAEWIARQIIEAFPWDEAPRYLIRDRDTSYGAAVTRRLRTMGIRDRPITPRSPWQNGHVERLIGSIRRECLDHVVVLGEGHLRHLLANYGAYYNGARTHLALDKDTPLHRPVQAVGRIASVSWLGGLHHQYVRMA